MPFLFFELLLLLIFLIFVIGAAVLWAKTKRAAVLVQLIACSLILLHLAIEQIAYGLFRAERPALLEAIRSSYVQPVGQIALVIGFVMFPVGYLWYALTQKRISDAGTSRSLSE